MAQAQRQQQLKKKSFSPKMLVYENLKNNNVLRHFKERFAHNLFRPNEFGPVA